MDMLLRPLSDGLVALAVELVDTRLLALVTAEHPRHLPRNVLFRRARS